MIIRGTGDLLLAQVDALVNTVNTEGVMGKGLALQFRRRFPLLFRDYQQACQEGALKVGRMHIVHQPLTPRFLINFPTKKRWRDPSTLAYIEAGLQDLLQQVHALQINSIALPPLGCGNGGLAWEAVKTRIEHCFAALPAVRVLLFGPESSLSTPQEPNPQLSMLEDSFSE